MRRWNVFAAGIALILLIVALTKSGPEIRAIRWHLKNGDRAVVHGISFPVYFWYAPTIRPDALDIHDNPGPLRPTEDHFSAIHISWMNNDRFAGLDRLNGLNAAQRAQAQAHSLEQGGYQNVQTFSRRYLDEEFVCVHELDPRFHHGDEKGGNFSCYADGPIYYIYFGGYGIAQDHFERMLTNAERVRGTAD